MSRKHRSRQMMVGNHPIARNRGHYDDEPQYRPQNSPRYESPPFSAQDRRNLHATAQYIVELVVLILMYRNMFISFQAMLIFIAYTIARAATYCGGSEESDDLVVNLFLVFRA
jgi:hypothetical protein